MCLSRIVIVLEPGSNIGWKVTTADKSQTESTTSLKKTPVLSRKSPRTLSNETRNIWSKISKKTLYVEVEQFGKVIVLPELRHVKRIKILAQSCCLSSNASNRGTRISLKKKLENIRNMWNIFNHRESSNRCLEDEVLTQVEQSCWNYFDWKYHVCSYRLKSPALIKSVNWFLRFS